MTAVSAGPDEQRTRLAIIDRDAELVAAVRASATRRGWDSHALRRAIGGRQLAEMRIDALVFDPAMLGDPWTWVQDLDARLPELVLIVCTAHSTVDERVDALSLGVDDWLVKPADPDELTARVERAVQRVRRRAEAAAEVDAEPIFAGEVEIDPVAREVRGGGATAGLTAREFEVFAAIFRGEGTVVARDQIFLRVWGYAMGPSDRSVDVYVGKVRAKLARVSPGYAYIHTHHRVGYRFDPRPLPAPTTEPVGEEA